MSNLPKTISPIWINGFFILGLLCNIAFRSLTIVSELSPELVRPVWYFGVVGYVIFFLFRYKISVKRRRAVQDFELIETLESEQEMTSEQRQAALYLLKSIIKSKENINYYAIFLLSTVAIIVDVVLCSIGK